MFLKILQNLQENTCARASFLIKLNKSLKKSLWHRCFPVNYAKFLRIPFLKLVSAVFIKFLFFHQMIALQKLWKMFFISSKKLFSFLRYSRPIIWWKIKIWEKIADTSFNRTPLVATSSFSYSGSTLNSPETNGLILHLTYFMPLVSFYIPPENIKKPLVF